MIDLHLHTTASDGRSTPDALVREAQAAGLTTIAVTDHDTTRAIRTTQAIAEAAGLRCLAGIEITAVARSRDVHVLGYFINSEHPPLLAFLESQREDRRRRVVAILERLEALGVPIDPGSLLTSGDDTSNSVGRPLVAAALVAAGHATDIADAFDRYLAVGQPAFVGRRGVSPAEVVSRIHDAGGVASLAHPGKMHIDEMIPDLVEQGLDAIEVFHPDHTSADQMRYLNLAQAHSLLVTGGSDYHGPGSGRSDALGRIGLPASYFQTLVARNRI